MASILLGITGGIAAYKSAEIASLMVKAGHSVQTVMTESAFEFIGPATFAALTAKPVVSSLFESTPGYPLGAHIELVEKVDLFCIAPTTANLLAKISHGLADDLLSTLCLTYTGKLLLAPAMNCEMWEKRVVQRNIAQLKEDGYYFVGPEDGWLSCRKTGTGRMAEPATVFKAVTDLLTQQ
ncbi:MAG: phosphopantothenoylcysteine decarboxylase [Pirellulaceae bacterium]|nr:phosphopantothenoylcysteine decarboxylase [Pirellulaceae bacterium]